MVSLQLINAILAEDNAEAVDMLRAELSEKATLQIEGFKPFIKHWAKSTAIGSGLGAATGAALGGGVGAIPGAIFGGALGMMAGGISGAPKMFKYDGPKVTGPEFEQSVQHTEHLAQKHGLHPYYDDRYENGEPTHDLGNLNQVGVEGKQHYVSLSHPGEYLTKTYDVETSLPKLGSTDLKGRPLDYKKSFNNHTEALNHYRDLIDQHHADL